jgi:hypothetical protein
MKRLYPLLLISFLCLAATACKKDAKPEIPVSITGKWQIQQYKLSSYVNGAASSSTATPNGWFTTADYYQLNPDGSAIESHADPSIGAIAFSFQVSNSDVILSRALTLLPATTCTYSMPTSSSLILKQETNEQSTTGNTYKIIEEVDLSK